jgi:hypothetical protein
MNLTNTVLTNFSLEGANLTGADLRGSNYDYCCGPVSYGQETTNLIYPSGHIAGVQLGAGQALTVRDYDGRRNYPIGPVPITVGQHFTNTGGTLRLVFEADDWNSTISFDAGIPVALGGTLELTFTEGVSLASQIGRTFDLFDWTGVNPAGAFRVASPYAWDLSNLYNTGEVTLLAIPEPTTVVLVALGLVGLVVGNRRPQPRSNAHSRMSEESHAKARRRRGVRFGLFSLRPPRLCVSLFSILICAGAALADIFQWEYVNPADPEPGQAAKHGACRRRRGHRRFAQREHLGP